MLTTINRILTIVLTLSLLSAPLAAINPDAPIIVTIKDDMALERLKQRVMAQDVEFTEIIDKLMEDDVLEQFRSLRAIKDFVEVVPVTWWLPLQLVLGLRDKEQLVKPRCLEAAIFMLLLDYLRKTNQTLIISTDNECSLEIFNSFTEEEQEFLLDEFDDVLYPDNAFRAIARWIRSLVQ